MNKRYPRYPDDGDYQTNAPSYYEDLARKQKLIQLLAEKIWEYEETLDLTLEEISNRLELYIFQNDKLMKDRLEQWDLNLEKFPENVELLLQEWLSDGTLDHIINETIFNWKADKTYVDDEIERLDQKDEDITEQLVYTTDKVNNLHVDITDYDSFKNDMGNGEYDFAPVLEKAIEEVGSGVIFIPNDITLFSSVIIPDFVTIKSSGINKSNIIVKQNVDALILSGSNSSIEDINVVVSVEGYDNSVITITNTNGDHVWSQTVKNVFINNEFRNGKQGNAIKIMSSGTKGIINFSINNFQIRGFEVGILIPEESVSWLNGGVIENAWVDYCVYGLHAIKSMGVVSINNFSGQFSSNITEYHIKIDVGTRFRITDSYMWDGGIIYLGPETKYGRIDGSFISPEKIKDYGYRNTYTLPEVGDSGLYPFIECKDDFLGHTISHLWRERTGENGSIQTGLFTSYGNPFKRGVRLLTGENANNRVTLDFGGGQQLNRFRPKKISFQFYVINKSNIVADLGFKNAYTLDDNRRGTFIRIINGNIVPTVFDGQEKTLASIPLKDKMYNCQILMYSNRVLFHLDNQFIGELSNDQELDVDPYFSVVNLENKDVGVIISHFTMVTSDYIE